MAIQIGGHLPIWLTTSINIVIGGGLTMLTAWLGDRRLSGREREKRHEEKRERLIAKRNEFQRDTLLALQKSSQSLVQNMGASLHQDRMALRSTGLWRRQKLPQELSDDGLQFMTETILLRPVRETTRLGTSPKIFAAK